MLYNVGSITIYGKPGDVRLSGRVWRVSDTTRLGRLEVWSGSTSLLELPPMPPRDWLRESAAMWLLPPVPPS